MRLLHSFWMGSLLVVDVQSFSTPSSHYLWNGLFPNKRVPRLQTTALFAELSEAQLKTELSEYLKKREEVRADEVAKAEVGTIIGGTRGNVVLDFVSGSPNKQRIQEEAANIFDYDELIKYGYSHLTTPIMEYGGRRAMYRLMDLTEPAVSDRINKPKSAPKLVIDRTGDNDRARYSGLKITQVLDDDAIGQALQETAKKIKEGKELRQKLEEEDYVMPFADNTNKGPRQTPLWTPEKLDEAGKKAGEAQLWARKARMGELKKDPYELLAVEGTLRVYSIFAVMTTALAFGKATSTVLNMAGTDADELIEFVRILGLVLSVAAAGSAAVNAVFLAPPKRRSSIVWGLKGLMGGPLAVIQLRELGDLKTFGESQDS